MGFDDLGGTEPQDFGPPSGGSDMQGQVQPSEMPGGGPAPGAPPDPKAEHQVFKGGMRQMLGDFLYGLGQGLQASSQARPGFGAMAGFGAAAAAPVELAMQRRKMAQTQALQQSEIEHRHALEKQAQQNAQINQSKITAANDRLTQRLDSMESQNQAKLDSAETRNAATLAGKPGQVWNATITGPDGKDQIVPGVTFANGKAMKDGQEVTGYTKLEKAGTTTAPKAAVSPWAKTPQYITAQLGPPPDPGDAEGNKKYGAGVQRIMTQVASDPRVKAAYVYSANRFSNLMVEDPATGEQKFLMVRNTEVPAGATPMSAVSAIQKRGGILGSFGELNQNLNEVKYGPKGVPGAGGGLESVPDDTTVGLSAAAMLSDNSIARFLGNKTADDNQKELAFSVRRLREGVLQARSIMGSAPVRSDAQVKLMTAQLPDTTALASLSAGDIKKQVSGFERILDQFQQRYSQLKGGGGGQSRGTLAYSDGGVTYNIPISQLSAFKKDHPNAVKR